MSDDDDDLRSVNEELSRIFGPPAPKPYQPVGEESSHEETLDAVLKGWEFLHPPPPNECRVPTVPFTTADLQTFHPERDPEFNARPELVLAKELLRHGPFSFDELMKHTFPGEGVYAIYYHGDMLDYAPLKSDGSTCSLYIGKAHLPRKKGKENVPQLCRRIRFHRKSLLQANLGLENFTFRFLLLPRDRVIGAEESLITLFCPFWNQPYLHGIGSRLCDVDTRAKKATPWDARHSNRVGTVGKGIPSQEKVEEIFARMPECQRAYWEAMKHIGPLPRTPRPSPGYQPSVPMQLL